MPGAVAGTGVASRLLTGLLPPALYAGLAALLFHPVWRAPLATRIGIPGDPQQTMWFWTWTQYAVRHGLNPLFSTFIDYPSGVNLMWNTTSSLMAILLWPVSALLGLAAAYDLAIAGSMALSAWTAYLLIRRFVERPAAAVAGGALYGFSPYMAMQALDHEHAVLVFLVPVILILLDEIVRVRRHPWPVLGALLGLACVAQFLMAEEVLAGTAILVFTLVALAAGFWPRHVLAYARAALPALLVALAVFSALLAYPVYFQLRGPLRVAGLTHPRDVFVTDALNFFVPTGLQQLSPKAAIDLTTRYTGGMGEANGYVGVPLALLLLVAAILLWRSWWARLAAGAAVVVALLSMGPHLHVAGVVHQRVPVILLALPLFALQRWLPAHVVVLVALAGWLALSTVDLLGNVTVVRLMVYFFLLAGLGVAALLDRALAAGRARGALAVVAVLVAFLPLVPRQPVPAAPFVNPPFFTGPDVARVPAGSVALVLPMAGMTNTDAMQWQAVSGMRFRMPDGYAFHPGTLLQLDPPASTTFALDRSIEAGQPTFVGNEPVRRLVESELAGWHVETIVVGPMAHQDQAVRYFTWLLDRPPEAVGGVYVWWRVLPGGT